jgi:AcrR family transcriptional regulator
MTKPFSGATSDTGEIASDRVGPGRRQRRRTDEVRGLILDAARQVFAERGYSGASTRLIAERASVSTPLIFNNFGTKAALFNDAVIEPFHARMAEFLQQNEAMPPDREARNAHFVHTLYPFLRDNADLLHALVKSAGDREAERLHALDDYFAAASSRMRSQYEKIGLPLEMPPELFVRYAFGMLAGAVMFDRWLFPDGEPHQVNSQDVLARMLFKAAEPSVRPSPDADPSRV